MNLLFEPAVRVLGRLRLAGKFLLIFLVFMVPLTWLVFSDVSDEARRIRRIEGEVAGLAYLQALRPLYERMARIRGMTHAYLQGADAFAPRIEAARRTLSDDLAKLRQIAGQFQGPAELRERAERIVREWASLQSRAFDGPAKDVFAAHSAIIEQVLSLMQAVVERSGLLVDPDLSRHFLMEIISLRIPRLTETLGKARGLGSGMAARGAFTTEQSLRLGGFLQTIRNERDAVEHAFTVLAEEVPDVAALLSERHRKALAATDHFVTMANERLLQADPIAVDAEAFFGEGTAAIDAALALNDAGTAQLGGLLAQRRDAAHRSMIFVVLAGVLVLLLVAYLFMGFKRSLTTAIDHMQETVAALAECDLTRRVQVSSRDEMQDIARNMNAMIERQKAVIAEVISASTELAATAGQGASTAAHTREVIDRQNQEIEQVATAMEEMSATVHEVAGNAVNTAEATRQAEAEATQGQQVVQETMTAIDELSEVLTSAGQVIQRLDDDANEIGRVLDVISEIAEQTNLLALNAAIEAARAGEQGRGFAVVADEVRTLAGRTRDSTQEIQAMIERLQGNAREAVAVMEQGNSRSRQTVERAGEAGRALAAITRAVEQITLMSQQIASAAEEQSCVAEEINRNVINVREIAHTTAEDARATAENSERLLEVADSLRKRTQQFRI